MGKTQNVKGRRRSGRRQKKGYIKVFPRRNVYGPVIRNINIRYTKMDNVSVKSTLVKGLIGLKVSFGNDLIFSGPNTFYRKFHEYRLLHATVTVCATHRNFSGGTPSTSLPLWLDYASVMAVVLRDLDSQDDDFNVFSDAISSPGSSHKCFTNKEVGRITKRWYPTETTDTTWRLTSNDGAFIVYLLLHPPTGKFSDDWLSLSYDIMVNIQLSIDVRSIDFSSSKVISVQSSTTHKDSESWTVIDLNKMDLTSPLSLIHI